MEAGERSNSSSRIVGIPVASAPQAATFLRSQSASKLHPNTATGSMHTTGDANYDKMLLKARKERARSEIALNLERDRNRDKQ